MAPSCTTDGLRVVIVGAGIGGLAAAIALTRAGHTCVVYEQAAQFTSPGMGLQLSPNGTRLLGRWGVADRLEPLAVRPEAIQILRWRDGGVLGQLKLGAACERAYGAPYLTVHRADLHRALLAEARRACGDGGLRLGARCVAVDGGPDRAEVTFTDGSRVSADLVLAADGIRSAVRAFLFGDPLRYSGVTIHRGLAPAGRLAFPPAVRIWLGPWGHVVTYPVSGGRELNVVVAATVAAEPRSWSTRIDAARVHAAYREWDPAVGTIVAAANPMSRWALYDRQSPARWTAQRVAFLGDAARPLLPLGAQGANQALEAAAALAECLRGQTSADVPSSLDRYRRLREPRMAKVAEAVQANLDNHHLPDGAEQRVRDEAMRAWDLSAQDWLYGYDVSEEAK